MLIIENNISETVNTWIKANKHSKYFVLVDENTNKHCLPKLNLNFDYSLIEIQSGEINKNLNTCQFIWNSLLVDQADRNTLLINLGGGVICDMGGFCASTYKRGIDFINIPTSLLSQVDASIGSKTGIDFNEQKNMIGLFSEADAIFINSGFLNTLDQRELLSGFAEVLKHGLIQDKYYFRQCLKQFQDKTIDWNDIINKSIEIKSTIVNADPKEKGLRKNLNFGHTVGHALESYSLKNHTNVLLHGEAVILGIISELYISYKKDYLSLTEIENIVSNLLSIYKFNRLEEFDYEIISKLVLNDKKNINNQIKIVLLESEGEAVFNQAVNQTELLDSLSYLKQKLSDA